MKRSIVLAAAALAVAAFALVTTVVSPGAQATAPAAPANDNQHQDWARARLEKSPRHQEWVKITYGQRTVQAFITYPEVKDKATAVVVIHEIYGLSDWARGMTDELAEQGYIAIAPDLLSGLGDKGGGTEAMSAVDIGRAISALPPAQIVADLNATVDYVTKLPSANGKVAVAGFCWGGGNTLLFANANPKIKAAFSFYGPQTADPANYAKIAAPVYGFYGGNDARVDAAIPQTTQIMKAAGKTYEPVTYDGAGHGFMRAGEDPANTVPANKTARDAAFQRWMGLMKKL